MIDFSNSIQLSYYSILISFVFVASILYLAKPKYLQKIDDTGEPVISWVLLLLNSVVVSIIFGVCVLLYCCAQKEAPEITKYELKDTNKIPI